MSGNYLYFIQAIEVECDTSRYFNNGPGRTTGDPGSNRVLWIRGDPARSS